jgi:stage V sporulation protein G
MEITEIRIKLKDDGKLRAFARLTFDDCFVVRGLKVIEGSNGMFVAMPSRKKPDGTFQDVAHPITNEMRQIIEKRVLEEYQQELEKEHQDLVEDWEGDDVGDAGPADSGESE